MALSFPHPRNPQQFIQLSVREFQIISRLLEAKQLKEIAAELGLTRGAVAQRLQQLFYKLGVNSQAEVIIWAMRLDVPECNRRSEDREPAA